MDVIVNEKVAVLKVLPLRDTVRCNQDIDFLILRKSHLLRALLRDRGKIGQYVVEISRERKCASVSPTALHQRNVGIAFTYVVFQLIIEVTRRIREGREDKNLSVFHAFGVGAWVIEFLKYLLSKLGQLARRTLGSSFPRVLKET